VRIELTYKGFADLVSVTVRLLSSMLNPAARVFCPVLVQPTANETTEIKNSARKNRERFPAWSEWKSQGTTAPGAG